MEAIVIQYCAVYDCCNTNETRPELTFFTVSREDSDKQVKFMEWSRYINPEHCKESSFIICEEHFNEDMIGVDGKQKILMPDALPVRQLGNTKPQQEPASIALMPKQVQPLKVKQKTRMLTVIPMTSTCRVPGLISVKLVPASVIKPIVSSALRPQIRSKANEILQNIPAGSSEQTSTAENKPQKRKAFALEDTPRPALHSEGTLGSASGSAQIHTSINPKATRSTSVQTIKPRVSAYHDYSSLCDRYLKKNLAQIVKIQANAGGTVVTEDLKSFYVELYTTSAEAYAFLQPTLSLPDPATLGLELGAVVKLEEADVIEIMPSTSKQ